MNIKKDEMVIHESSESVVYMYLALDWILYLQWLWTSGATSQFQTFLLYEPFHWRWEEVIAWEHKE